MDLHALHGASLDFGSHYLTLMADETTDIANGEQAFIFIDSLGN